jgi:hypothetical protein
LVYIVNHFEKQNNYILIDKLTIMYNTITPNRNGIKVGDIVEVISGVYIGLKPCEVISLGVTDRVHINIPVYKSLPNERNTAWISSKSVKLINIL